MFNSKVLVASLACLTIVACSDDDSDEAPTTPAVATNFDLSNLTGLEDLGATHKYEGWIIVNGSPVSTGTFSVNSSGALSQSAFTVDQTMLDSATKFVLTVEPSPDSDPMPSAQKLVAGDFSGKNAPVSTATAPALGDFSTAAGSYFLRTPTDEMPGGMNNGNDMNGVWFGNPGMPPTAGFTLPDLTGSGWTYEGWVVTANGPISTGTFTNFGAADSGNPFSGTLNNAGPPIPGEDFFTAPTGSADTYPIDVRGKTVVISVEPVPDNSPMPFLLKPLVHMVDMNAATAPSVHAFGQNLSSLPGGWVAR
ncbi:MAG: anti-sigma factor [Flavobacteriales bacterium]|nr:anti-sigma factor [Flavobacteriales bacterium]